MRVLVTGSREFCEQRDGFDFMDERRALAFALDFAQPKEIIVSTADSGASRWAKIWAEKRSVSIITIPDFNSAVALKPEYAVCFGIGAKQCREHGIDCYEVRMK